MPQISNVNIVSSAPLTPPAGILAELPLAPQAAATVLRARAAVADILERRDKRLLVIAGPCSIHDQESAVEYARRLGRLGGTVAERICLLMRVYFEKPRTTLGWKGLMYDPDMDGSYNIEKGIRTARRLLLDINGLGVPAATEMLDPVIPQYTADLIAWAAIGARTTESQTHRQLASGLSMPTGFKNTTDGSIQVAVDAILTAASPHSFLGVNPDGRTAVFSTSGNRFCHLVLRGGGAARPNYGSEFIAFARELLRKASLPVNIMVDCSHDNSGGVPERQVDVLRDILRQIKGGERDIIGVMLESNLEPGRQELKAGRPAAPGLSVTDACLGWADTEALVREAYAGLR